jgi:hypothetical protein
MMKKYIFIYLLMISFLIPQQDCDCEEPVNVWFKVSTDQITYGKAIALDMSYGYSFADETGIYLIVFDVDGNQMYLTFPNGGDWVAQVQDPFLDELEKEFKSLEDYLRATKNKSSEIKKKQ